jgi:hypothetical protein
LIKPQPATLKQAAKAMKTRLGASQITNKGRRNLISTGLQPGDDVRKPSGRRFNGFRMQE